MNNRDLLSHRNLSLLFLSLNLVLRLNISLRNVKKTGGGQKEEGAKSVTTLRLSTLSNG